MSNQNGMNAQGGKKQRTDFAEACGGVKFTLKGRLARAHILSTFDYQNKGFPKHSTYLIVDPNDQRVQQMIQTANALKNQFYPHVPDLLWNHPIKDGRLPTRPNGDQWQEWQKGQVFLGCSTGVDFPPSALVRDPNAPKGYRDATLLDERSIFYDGAEAVIEVKFGAMEGNNKGINLYFNAILGMGSGERIVITSGSSFNADDAFKDFLGNTAGGMNQGQNNQQQNYNANQNQGQNNQQQNYNNQGQHQQQNYNANQNQNYTGGMNQGQNNQQQNYNNQGNGQGQYTNNQSYNGGNNQGQYGNGQGNGGSLV